MLEVGLKPINVDGQDKMTGQKIGHKVIPNGKFRKAFEKMPLNFKLPWRVFVEEEADQPKKDKAKSGKRVKYTCPDCQANVWGKSGLDILCQNCDISFQENSPKKED